MDVKNILKKRRLELGLTQLDVAKAVGVSEATVSRWESGDIENIRRNNIAELSKVLQISPHLIVGWDGITEDENEVINEAIRLLRCNGSSVDIEDRRMYVIHNPDLIPLDQQRFLQILQNIKQRYQKEGYSFDSAVREFFGSIAVTYPQIMESYNNPDIMSEKYKGLDEHGKRIVDMVLEEEYSRCTSLDKPDETDMNYRSIPYSILPASAGSGDWFEDNDWETIDIPDIPGYSLADFAVRVHGDSMTPDYEDGDIVLIHQQNTINEGDIGLFWVEGKGGFIKKMGHGMLISINPKYGNIKYDTNIGRCFGKVIAKWIKE